MNVIAKLLYQVCTKQMQNRNQLVFHCHTLLLFRYPVIFIIITDKIIQIVVMSKMKIYCTIAIIMLFIMSLVKTENSPVIIKTPARSYDEPTLDEYQKCFESYMICKQACAGEVNLAACENDCPVCPILIKQHVLVQGVNDSLYQPPVSNAINTTNIIKITNDIHNVIKHKLPNITAQYENNVHIPGNTQFDNDVKITPRPIYVNESTMDAGDFGLGSNDNGSCCIVIRPSKNCELKQLSNSLQCHTKRRLVCGDKCQARVMYAKSVLNCKKDEDGNENCSRRIEYVPFTERRYEMEEPKCYFVPRWPYVSCLKERPSAKDCQRCLQLPYGYVLTKGLPPLCIYCLSESPFFAGYNEFDLYSLRQDDNFENSNWQQQVPAFQKYYETEDMQMFKNMNFDLEGSTKNIRRKRNHHK